MQKMKISIPRNLRQEFSDNILDKNICILNFRTVDNVKT